MVYRWILFLVSCVGWALAAWRLERLTDDVIDEVNAMAEPKDRLEPFRVGRWKLQGFLKRHKRYYPVSGLRRRMNQAEAMFVMMWLVTTLALFWLIGRLG